MVEISVVGISLQEEGKTPLLLLHPRGSQGILAIYIGPMEAFAISLALHGTPQSLRENSPNDENSGEAALFPRPLTHDLIVRMLHALGAKLASVHLTAVVEGAYIAEAILAHANGRAVVDCRPSDGIAIALRCGAPILASSAVASQARDSGEILQLLPEHIRASADAKLSALYAETVQAAPRAPRAVQAALAAMRNDPRRELISVAHKMLDEERAREKVAIAMGLEQLLAALEKSAPRRLKVDAPMPEAQGPDRREADSPPRDAEERRANLRPPQIRVSLVRHTEGGKTEVVNEFTVPQTNIHIPAAALAGLGLSPREAEAVNDASDDDRWAMLLRILAPETKVPM